MSIIYYVCIYIHIYIYIRSLSTSAKKELWPKKLAIKTAFLVVKPSLRMNISPSEWFPRPQIFEVISVSIKTCNKLLTVLLISKEVKTSPTWIFVAQIILNVIFNSQNWLRDKLAFVTCFYWAKKSESPLAKLEFSWGTKKVQKLHHRVHSTTLPRHGGQRHDTKTSNNPAFIWRCKMSQKKTAFHHPKPQITEV